MRVEQAEHHRIEGLALPALEERARIIDDGRDSWIIVGVLGMPAPAELDDAPAISTDTTKP